MNSLLSGPSQDQIDALLKGSSEEQVTISEAQLEQARITLETARANLAASTLTAPFDGIVTGVHTSKGEVASGVVIDLVDAKSLKVVLSVDEVDLGEIQRHSAGKNIYSVVLLAKICPRKARIQCPTPYFRRLAPISTPFITEMH